ncbi:MAG: hypothetical protein AAFZ07_18780 [Actinomycetota bacterium]
MAAPHDWVTGFLDRAAGGLPLDRLRDVSPGLDASGVLAVLDDPRLGSHGVEALSELLHPTDSMYFDAIFGAFHGQVAIRSWLVPTMRDISFIEFVPTAPAQVFGGDAGTSSVHEWQMWATIGDDRIPLPRGVSTRHHRDGWVTWNADVYDTAPMRVPPPDAEIEAAPLPDPPRITWDSTPPTPPPRSAALDAWLATPPDARGPLDHADLHTIMVTPELGLDPEVVVPLFHPTDSHLVEPGGEYVGCDAIGSHLDRRRGRRTAMTLETIGPPLFNGESTAFEWVARTGSDPEQAVRGTSVCRYADGYVVHAADYYDRA